MTTPDTDLVERLVSGLTEALKQTKTTPQRPVKLVRFTGWPVKPGDLNIREWLEEVEVYCRQCKIPDKEKAQAVVNHLGGTAREEIKCHEGVKSDYKALVKVLRRHFGDEETVQSLQKTLYDRTQHEDESLMDYSRSLMRIHDRILEAALDTEKAGLKEIREKVLIRQFVAGVRNPTARLELRRLELAKPGQSFSEMRDSALELFRDIEKTPKMRKSQAREVRVHDDEVSDENDPFIGVDHSESAGVLSAAAQSESKWQRVLQQQEEMLKCIQSQQEQLTKMMEHVLKLESPQQQGNQAAFKSRVICYFCKRPGHVKAKCRSWLTSQGQQSNAGADNGAQPAAGVSRVDSQGLNQQPPPL